MTRSVTRTLHDYLFAALQRTLEEEALNEKHALPLFQSLHLGGKVELPAKAREWSEGPSPSLPHVFRPTRVCATFPPKTIS
jgi:NAD(P)H-dependent FMN reductase